MKKKRVSVVLSLFMAICLFLPTFTVVAESEGSFPPAVEEKFDSEATESQVWDEDSSHTEDSFMSVEDNEQQTENTEQEKSTNKISQPETKTIQVAYPYEYPPYEEWNYIMEETRYEPLNIPEEYLAQMDTASLIEAVLDYPALAEIFTFSTVQGGFEMAKTRFNGLRKLLVRPDVGPESLKAYRVRDVYTQIEGSILEERYDDFFDLTYLEIILGQEEVIETLGANGQEDVMAEVEETIAQKLEHPDIYSFISTDTFHSVLKGQGLIENEPEADAMAEGPSLRSGFDPIYTPGCGTSCKIPRTPKGHLGRIDTNAKPRQ